MQAALARDEATRKLEETTDVEKKLMITEYLQAELNKNSRLPTANLALGSLIHDGGFADTGATYPAR